MNYELINQILAETGIEYSYYQFLEPPTGDKYIAYLEISKERFLADDRVYSWTPTFAIELYTRIKDLETEQELIDLFDSHGLVWSGGESEWIEQERIFQTVFYV